MARVLKDFDFRERRPTASYLDQWLDGQVWELSLADANKEAKKADLFGYTSLFSFIAALRHRATKLGLKLRTRSAGYDNDKVIVQSYKEES